MKNNEKREYEERVKARVLILKKLLEDGTIKLVRGSQVENSLKKARFDENGEPDLSTIDNVIRSMALVAEHHQYKKEVKDEVSLYDIQQQYFEILHSNFGEYYKVMIRDSVDPEIVARTIAYGEHDISHLNGVIDVLLDILKEFWEVMYEPALYHLEDDHTTIKAVFGGDLFPSYTENIASKCGIYTDTIILPCPFIRSIPLFDRWDEKQRVYFLLKHVLNVLQYRDLALAEVDVPIVVVVPDKEMLEEEEFKQTQTLGGVDGLHHASKVFGRPFESLEDLFAFAETLDTTDKVINEIKDKSRVLFDTTMEGTIEEQIESQTQGMSAQVLGTSNPGMIVASMGLGRMGTCNELLMKSYKLRGVPLVNVPTSWEYFKWKLEYDAEREHGVDEYRDMHIVHGINQLSETPLKWIGRIPPSGLIELRKSGAINEIRGILSKGIKELTEENKLDFVPTTHKVFNNINKAFAAHEENIRKLQRKKWTIAGKDIVSFFVVGSIELAAACIGTPLYGGSAFAMSQITDAPKLKDLPASIKEIKSIGNEQKDLGKSPVGLMFKYKDS